MNIVFCLSAHHDFPLAYACVRHIRRAYPKNRIILFTDDDPAPCFSRLALGYNVEFEASVRAYRLYFGGFYWKRFLTKFLSGPGDLLMKVDTDTKIFRKFTKPFEGGDAYGTVTPLKEWASLHVQGGCKAMPREYCEELMKLGIFDDTALTDPATWAAPGKVEAYKRFNIISEDRILWWVHKQTGAVLVDHPEIHSIWLDKRAWCWNADELELVTNRDLRFAATHPHDLEMMRSGLRWKKGCCS